MKKLYALRDPKKLEPYYSAHVSAMTSEGLHSKAVIAAELAFRDAEIERLKAALKPFADAAEEVENSDYGWEDRDRVKGKWFFSDDEVKRAASALKGSS